MPAPSPAATDKRILRSRENVLAFAYKLLSEGGINGLCIDEISRRSGVSKTTIYRHWASRSALLLEACSTMGCRPEIPDTGSLRGDVTALARHLAGQMHTARWPAVLPSIIDAAERDPELAAVHARLHAGLMVPFVTIAERARRRGDYPSDRTPAEFAAALMAPFFYRRWFSREPIDERFVLGVVRSLVGPPRRK